ncbi:hypothetical protein [Pedobacter sp. Leaf170]|uniref:hypothetical protein n=1 Tax=Pedobacter sp. Leaf170 TaxID=2876558 RepID=UPI001E4FF01C|nr:hypothetical protein [Pedobacter sp. Leaf170]
MEPASNANRTNPSSPGKMVVLDYLFEDQTGLKAYQLIRQGSGAVWLVLDDDELLATLDKTDGRWAAVGDSSLDVSRLNHIGSFIDKQHFNFLPGKIKSHWADWVQEVVMENDSAYLVICRANTDFFRFKSVFSAFIGQLVEDEWEITFKVYNADFTDEFMVRVY